MLTAGTGPQRLHLAPQAARFERVVDEHGKFVHVERFVDVVEGAELHRFDGILDRRVGGHQDDRRVRVQLFHLLEDCQSVRVRQSVIQQDQVDGVARLFQGAGRRAGLQDGQAFVRQPFLDGPANERFVVHHENGGIRHPKGQCGFIHGRCGDFHRSTLPKTGFTGFEQATRQNSQSARRIGTRMRRDRCQAASRPSRARSSSFSSSRCF